MKYMRKTPVEAIQWTGDNQREVYDFMNKTARTCCNMDDGFGNLIMFWKDFARRRFKAVIPKFGWVVREGNTFQFYKDDTFRKTFEAVADDCKGIDWKSVKAITEAFCGFGVEPSKETSDVNRMRVQIDPDGRLTKLIDNLFKDDEKTREEIKKNMSEGLKEMAGGKTKGTEFDTFESVLDEMKELHAKKNACYGDAVHVNFLKYGPVASLSRLSEKMQRAEHILLSGKCEVNDEPLTSTLIDIAITSAMLYMELKNKENGADKD